MKHATTLRVALVSSEVAPFAQSGGLGEMVGSLGPALKDAGIDPFFILPRYGCIRSKGWKPLQSQLSIPLGDRTVTAGIWKGKHPSGIPVYAIDIPEFYDRPALYGEKGVDYVDNAARFAAFCRGTVQLLKKLRLRCDVIHTHDWQTALIPLYLKEEKDTFFYETRTVFTIHNLGYQGLFDVDDFSVIGLKDEYLTPRYLEFYGRISLMKGGIISADAVTAVSPTYAQEIVSGYEFGYGLVGVLKDREKDLVGILNGIDTREWDPVHDPHLPVHFSKERLDGKAICKESFQREMGLPERHDVPLIVMVNRMVSQKGLDLVIPLLPTFVETDVQWAFLGEGEPGFEETLAELAKQYPEKIATRIGFDVKLTHRAVAAADFLLMPSQYEPCGLAQMYGMRYGAVPIVRAVGGLADTVKDVMVDPKKGTGFSFAEGSVTALRDVVEQALTFYKGGQERMALCQRIMALDFSWSRSAKHYSALYHKILKRPSTFIPPGPSPL